MFSVHLAASGGWHVGILVITHANEEIPSLWSDANPPPPRRHLHRLANHACVIQARGSALLIFVLTAMPFIFLLLLTTVVQIRCTVLENLNIVLYLYSGRPLFVLYRTKISLPITTTFCGLSVHQIISIVVLTLVVSTALYFPSTDIS